MIESQQIIQNILKRIDKQIRDNITRLEDNLISGDMESNPMSNDCPYIPDNKKNGTVEEIVPAVLDI